MNSRWKGSDYKGGLTNCSERARYKYETNGLKPGHDNLILQLSNLPKSGVLEPVLQVTRV